MGAPHMRHAHPVLVLEEGELRSFRQSFKQSVLPQHFAHFFPSPVLLLKSSTDSNFPCSRALTIAAAARLPSPGIAVNGGISRSPSGMYLVAWDRYRSCRPKENPLSTISNATSSAVAISCSLAVDAGLESTWSMYFLHSLGSRYMKSVVSALPVNEK